MLEQVPVERDLKQLHHFGGGSLSKRLSVLFKWFPVTRKADRENPKINSIFQRNCDGDANVKLQILGKSLDEVLLLITCFVSLEHHFTNLALICGRTIHH